MELGSEKGSRWVGEAIILGEKVLREFLSRDDLMISRISPDPDPY